MLTKLQSHASLPSRSKRLVPVTRSQFNRHPLPHAVHNLINRPRLPLVAWREVGRNSALVEADALLHRLDVLGVVLVGVDLWVVVPDPARVLGLCETRVELDFAPVGFLQELGVGEAHFLGAGVADEAGDRVLVVCKDYLGWLWEGLPVSDVGLDGFRDLVFAGELQAGSDGDGVLNSLGSTVTGCGQESVCGITNLNHARGGRSPGELRVTPEKLEVDDGVGRCDLDQLLEHG